MSSELECRICYVTYNAGARCPRELRCKHSFCTSCLRLLVRPHDKPHSGASRMIVCPLCRGPTAITHESNIKAELKVDEAARQRLMAAGLFHKEDEEKEEAVEKTPPPPPPRRAPRRAPVSPIAYDQHTRWPVPTDEEVFRYRYLRRESWADFYHVTI